MLQRFCLGVVLLNEGYVPPSYTVFRLELISPFQVRVLAFLAIIDSHERLTGLI